MLLNEINANRNQNNKICRSDEYKNHRNRFILAFECTFESHKVLCGAKKKKKMTQKYHTDHRTVWTIPCARKFHSTKFRRTFSVCPFLRIVVIVFFVGVVVASHLRNSFLAFKNRPNKWSNINHIKQKPATTTLIGKTYRVCFAVVLLLFFILFWLKMVDTYESMQSFEKWKQIARFVLQLLILLHSFRFQNIQDPLCVRWESFRFKIDSKLV